VKESSTPFIKDGASILKKGAVSLKDNATKLGKKAYENLPDSETTKETLKSASKGIFVY